MVLTVIITLAGTAGVLAFKDNQKVPPGTRVGGIDVSGLKYSQAHQRLQQSLQIDNSQELVLRQGNKTVKYPLSELGIFLDIDASLDKIRDENGLFDSVADRAGGTNDYSPSYGYDKNKLELLVARAGNDFDQAAGNARVYVDGDGLARSAEVPGFKTDNQALADLIKQRLHEGDFTEIEVPGKVLSPEITAAQLEPIKDLVAVYVTSFTPEPETRAHNISLAAQRINNTILMPGQTFSFNQVIGERTAANGFQPAPVYQNGKTVKDLGGGICQVATTLYNAAVGADLQITERQPHSLTVDYAEPGQDATIAWGQHDLKFVNTTGSPILIAVQSQNGKVQARVYGKNTDPSREIKLVSDKKSIAPPVNVITNPRLNPGQQITRQKGAPGYESITYRVEIKNGKEVSRTQVSTDTYKPRPWIIEVAPGTKPNPGSK